MLGLININTNSLYNRNNNEVAIMERSNKNRAENYARAQQMINEEKDPVKRQIMRYRLAVGITNFSDL